MKSKVIFGRFFWVSIGLAIQLGFAAVVSARTTCNAAHEPAISRAQILALPGVQVKIANMRQSLKSQMKIDHFESMEPPVGKVTEWTRQATIIYHLARAPSEIKEAARKVYNRLHNYEEVASRIEDLIIEVTGEAWKRSDNKNFFHADRANGTDLLKVLTRRAESRGRKVLEIYTMNTLTFLNDFVAKGAFVDYGYEYAPETKNWKWSDIMKAVAAHGRLTHMLQQELVHDVFAGGPLTESQFYELAGQKYHYVWSDIFDFAPDPNDLSSPLAMTTIFRPYLNDFLPARQR